MTLALQELLVATERFELTDERTPLLWPLYGPETLGVRCLAAGAGV